MFGEEDPPKGSRANPIDLDAEMPGLVPRGTNADNIYKYYRVRYYKGDLDDLECLSMIQDLESKALQGDEVVLVDRKISFFQNTCTVVLRYMEKLSPVTSKKD